MYKIGKFTKTINPIEQFSSRGPNFQIVETIVIWGSPNRSHCLFSPRYSAAPTKQKVFKYIVLGHLVKRGITEFRRGIPDVLLTHEKNFTAVIIGYISIRCYDVW